MAVAALNTSTLSEALTAETSEFAVGSTSNIIAGYVLVVRGEVMRVSEVPVSGRVKVTRGRSGTKARAHANGTRFFIGSPEKFSQIRNTAEQIGLVGAAGTLPDYLLPGARAYDGDGNVYIMVDLTFQAYSGVTVLISKDGLYTASAFTNSDYGSIGIVTEEGTSDQYVWAQVYGFYSGAQFTSGSSLATSTGVIQGATTASVPVGALLGRTTSLASSDDSAIIHGMFLASAVTTGTTAATSHTGFKADVWLNYPYKRRTVSS